MRPPISYALANIPRYTSYPTAPHFGPLAEPEYRQWLGAIGAGDALSVYLHIPFCQALCWYCGCHTAVTRSAARLSGYAAALEAELALLAGALRGHAGIAHLHLGGGTPTALGAAALARVLRRLRETIGLAPGAEIAAELDPRSLNQATVEALAEAGLTRASLGVQDINPAVQQRIGRAQSTDCVAETVARLRAHGIASINLDVMYGLPGQGVAEVQATCRFAAALGAERVAVFGYAHVPWMKSHQNAIDSASLPGALERIAQAEAAQQVLVDAGYQAIGLDHFALPGDAMAIAAREGRLHRNFQGYTTDTSPALLGLGASAIGSLPAGYAQNDPDERRYVAAVAAGALPVRRGRALSAEDRLRRSAIERVMCDFALDLSALPPSVLDGALPTLAQLDADGIIQLERDYLRVTPAGRSHVRHVAAAFDAFLGAGSGRHSAAV
jgi:oxygen-independent coproporphyrinogen-3 oxidase